MIDLRKSKMLQSTVQLTYKVTSTRELLASNSRANRAQPAWSRKGLRRARAREDHAVVHPCIYCIINR